MEVKLCKEKGKSRGPSGTLVRARRRCGPSKVLIAFKKQYCILTRSDCNIKVQCVRLQKFKTVLGLPRMLTEK